MAEIAIENGRISSCQGLMTLTLDWVILHTVVYHSSTSTYMPNFVEIKETFCGRTDGHLRHTLLGQPKDEQQPIHLPRAFKEIIKLKCILFCWMDDRWFSKWHQ